MSRLTERRAGLATFLLSIAASLAMAMLAAPVVSAGVPLGLSDNYSSDCKPGTNDNIDPVTVLFRGTQASAGNASSEVERVAEWDDQGEGDQSLKVEQPNEKYACRNVDFQPASEPEFEFKPWLLPINLPLLIQDLIEGDPLDFLDPADERFHVRLWFVDSSLNETERKTVGTPHFEYFKEWNRGVDTCKGIKWEIEGHTIFAKGSHAVKKGGGKTGEDSGFDEGRQELRRAFLKTRHKVHSAEPWGNDELIKQCDQNFAGSNGNGITIEMDWVHGGVNKRPMTRQRNALLRARLKTTKESTDWWFEYGPSPSAGASSYPNKTAVKSVSGAAEVDVSQPVAGLSPGSTYYSRMFVRDEKGDVEESNEVEFKTCGWEMADEDDGSRGPGAATPECGGAVDSFYRDVNGDLGHQSWSPSGVWSTETRPASIVRSAVPRVLHRADGSGVVDVFLRETDGDLGHHWWTPGSGWQEEALGASMASDPNVIERPNGTIDVFYRTSSGELGHKWWSSGSGWSSETRNATVSSGPHAIVHGDGSIDVLYRNGTALGRDHRSAGGVWSRETRSGSLVAEPRPLVGKSGAMDVFYRTSEGKLGHDWFVPGSGWSRETRSAALVSEPHVVNRPNGTVDVFYRTPGDELGHDWWVSGSGWSTETRPADLSSDPRVVARSDGSLEVFYREGNRLGHQWFVPGEGWSAESRPGPIAAHTDPHFATQDDGRIDVIYETPSGQLGRDAYMPGRGWSHELRPMRRPSRPVAAYSFDAGTGEVAEDLFGNHDGALENTEWTKGRYGSAIYLDGNDDYVEIPDSPELALNEEFTIETWVRPDEDATWESVIWKETQNAYSYTLMAGGEEAGVPEGALADEKESWVDVEGKEDLPDPAWSHLALTYDGANLRLYVDGELIDTEPAPPNSENSEGRLFFGTNDYEDFFNGSIDEVRLYERALDAGEIAADRATPLESPPSEPVAAYSFDEGEGTHARDRAGENDGELVHTEWVEGKYGSAVYLDGNDDYVEIPDSPELQLTEEFTLEAWVRPDGIEDKAVVISKDASNFYSYQLYAGAYEDAGVPEGFLGYGGEAFEDVEAEDPLTPKTWSHLALTYDGVALRLYVNGVLADTDPSAPPAQASVGPLLLGGNDDEEFFKGRIDEVRLYDRALSPAELIAND